MTTTSLYPETAAPLFGRPGTSAPVGPAATGRRFIVATLLAGATVFGTISTATPADADALRAAAAAPRTVPAVPPQTPATMVDSRSVPNLLRRLRDRADLNWGDVAQALGVSRRTVHNWLTGGQIAATHLSRLLELESLVDAADAGDSVTTRVHLTTPGPQGRSLLADFALGSRPVRNVPLSTVSAADLLEPETPGGNATEAVAGPTRRSSLRGGSLPRRRPQAS